MEFDAQVHESLGKIQNFPEHVAIIMDGNRRWGKQREEAGGILAAALGHRNGYQSLRNLVPLLATTLASKIRTITFYAFSSENWQRSPLEVSTIFDIASVALDSDIPLFMQNNIRLKILGDRKGLPLRLQHAIEQAETATSSNQGLNVVIALNYGGMWDITEAFKNVFKLAKMNSIEESHITTEMVSKHLASAYLPPVDLLIRTGGEKRISNFVLWQLAYAELHFTDILWPDFQLKDLITALEDFDKRKRRFGRDEPLESNV